MKPNRLTRLLVTLRLLRRNTCSLLLSIRGDFAAGRRGRSLHRMRLYRSMRADVERLTHDVGLRMAALIRCPASAY